MRIKAMVNLDHNVFVSWVDKNTSGTLNLTPEEAEAIGDMGRMARARREVALEDSDIVLKDSAFESEIKDMKIGESGYAVPWALEVDKKKRPWLKLSHMYDTERFGTMQMLVQRLEEDLWRVVLPRGERLGIPNDPHPHWEVSYNLKVVTYEEFWK